MIPKCENCKNGGACTCKKYIYYFLEGVLALVIIIGLAVKMTSKEDTWLCENGQWIKHGNPSASMPTEKCEADNIIENASIEIFSPLPQQSITSPLTITGKARGNWFFEASFPISIVNWDGLIIGQGIAQAQGEWMTEEFVPFEARITFDKATYKNNGSIILQKDNPSGLPENDDALEIPIFFK